MLNSVIMMIMIVTAISTLPKMMFFSDFLFFISNPPFTFYLRLSPPRLQIHQRSEPIVETS